MDVNMYQWVNQHHPNPNVAGQVAGEDFTFTPWMVVVWLVALVLGIGLTVWGAYGA